MKSLNQARLDVLWADYLARQPDRTPRPLAEFLAEQCHHVDGALIPLTEFREHFNDWMEQNYPGRRPPGLADIIAPLPCYGTYTGNRRYVANMSWFASTPPSRPYRSQGGKLVRDTQ